MGLCEGCPPVYLISVSTRRFKDVSRSSVQNPPPSLPPPHSPSTLWSGVAFTAPSSLQLHIPLSLHSCSIIVLPRLPPTFSLIRPLFFTSDDVILVQTVAIAPRGHGSNILTDSPAFTPISSSPFCTQSPQDGIFKPSLIVPFPCLTLLGSFPLSLCKAWPGVQSPWSGVCMLLAPNYQRLSIVFKVRWSCSSSGVPAPCPLPPPQACPLYCATCCPWLTTAHAQSSEETDSASLQVSNTVGSFLQALPEWSFFSPEHSVSLAAMISSFGRNQMAHSRCLTYSFSSL